LCFSFGDTVSGNINIATDDRLDPRGLGGTIEFDSAIQDGVVGHGEVVHSHITGEGESFFYFEGAV